MHGWSSNRQAFELAQALSYSKIFFIRSAPTWVKRTFAHATNLHHARYCDKFNSISYPYISAANVIRASVGFLKSHGRHKFSSDVMMKPSKSHSNNH